VVRSHSRLPDDTVKGALRMRSTLYFYRRAQILSKRSRKPSRQVSISVAEDRMGAAVAATAHHRRCAVEHVVGVAGLAQDVAGSVLTSNGSTRYSYQ
jgi:hypothetical protein